VYVKSHPTRNFHRLNLLRQARSASADNAIVAEPFHPSAKGPCHYHAWLNDATSLIGRQKSGSAGRAYSGVKHRN
jgi:hypothetical protein